MTLAKFGLATAMALTLPAVAAADSYTATIAAGHPPAVFRFSFGGGASG